MRKNTASDLWRRTTRATVGPDDCWEWVGKARIEGYGIMRYCGANLFTHRAAWMFTFGDIEPGLFVCHHCDNRLCCNPEHLFLGTQMDNMRDKVAKGRARGQAPGCRILTPEQLQSAVARHSSGETCRALATEFGVTYQVLTKWVRRHAA